MVSGQEEKIMVIIQEILFGLLYNNGLLSVLIRIASVMQF